MEKIIKRTISLTTRKRDSRNKLFEEFYSHDKNTATFEFTVEGGIPTEEIVVLFHFKRTNRHLEVRGRVDNDKIIVNFDTSLIIKDEQVAGYIYYENGEKSNDVYRFMFDVHVSEIDKEHDLPIIEQESKRIVPLTDIVTKSEITELLKKIVANEKLYDDTEIKQQIESKADKETVQAISSKVDALENNSGNSTTYDDAELRGKIATKADTQTVEAIAQRVQTLEGKPDNDTVYNDTELRQAVEAKADKEALLQYLPKSELTPINEKVQSIETNIGRMATQQQLEGLVSKNDLEQKGYLTSADTHNFALKSEIPVVPPQADLSNLATKQEIEDVVKRAELTQVTDRVASLEARPQIDTSKLVTKEELEAKGYLSTAPDLSEYAKKSEIPAQFDGSALTERINALENKAISNGAYNDKPLLDKIHEVQESLKGFITQSSRYLTEHQSLAHLVTKDELARMGYINAHQSLEHLVTKQELENKHYLTNEDISNLATNSKVEAVESRVETLENKPPVDLSNLATKQELEEVRGSQPSIDTHNFATKEELEAVRNSQQKVDTSNFVTKEELHEATEIDYSQIVTHEELEAKHYLQNQALEGYAKKTEIPKIDTSSFITKQELEAKQYLKDHQPLDGYVKKTELPPQVDTSTLVSKQELTSMNLVNAEALGNVSKKILEQTNKIIALESKSEFEIHGTGMPNGRVTAPIGTTYVDMNVTNGALKWIKRTGTGNTGWQVFTGDTGWRTLPLEQKRGTARLQIRRINDQVIVKFDGLQWGWFGVNDIEKLGGSVVEKTIGGKKYTWIKLSVGRGVYVLPEGFRSASSLLSGLYGDLGDLLGSVYVGGTADSNAIQLRYAMPKEQITSNILSQIRISPITFITDDDYPTTLP